MRLNNIMTNKKQLLECEKSYKERLREALSEGMLFKFFKWLNKHNQTKTNTSHE